MGGIIIPLMIGLMIAGATFNYSFNVINSEEKITKDNDSSSDAAEIAVAGIHISKDSLMKNLSWGTSNINSQDYNGKLTYMYSDTLKYKIKDFDVNKNNSIKENLNLLYLYTPASGTTPDMVSIVSEGKKGNSKVVLGTKFKLTRLPIQLPVAFSKTSSYTDTQFCSVPPSSLGTSGNGQIPTYSQNPNISIVTPSGTSLAGVSILGNDPSKISVYLDAPAGTNTVSMIGATSDFKSDVTNIITDAQNVNPIPSGVATSTDSKMPDLLSNNVLNSAIPTSYVNYPALNTNINYPAYVNPSKSNIFYCDSTNPILPYIEYTNVTVKKGATCRINVNADSLTQNFYMNSLNMIDTATLEVNINSSSIKPVTFNIGALNMSDGNPNSNVNSHIIVNNNTNTNTSFITIKADTLIMGKQTDIITNNVNSFLLDVNKIETNHLTNYSASASKTNLQGTIIARQSANLQGTILLGNLITNDLITNKSLLCNVVDANGNVMSPSASPDFFNITSFSTTSYQDIPILEEVISSICKDINSCF